MIGIKVKVKGFYRFVDNVSIFYVKLILSLRFFILSFDIIEIIIVDFY